MMLPFDILGYSHRYPKDINNLGHPQLLLDTHDTLHDPAYIFSVTTKYPRYLRLLVSRYKLLYQASHTVPLVGSRVMFTRLLIGITFAIYALYKHWITSVH